MNSRFPWRTALKIAWRESRASSGKFLFVVLAVAVGAAALTGVRGFSRVFRAMMLRDARTLMAADMSVRVFDMPDSRQEALFASLARRGVRRTWITETVSMMSSPAVADPLLVSVKAVEPSQYPFYGQVKLSPAGTLRDRLTPEAIGVSEDLLLRLNVAVGDKVKLGAEEFRIAAVVVSEPDRMAGSLNIGPRVMITREGLDRTGLLRPGSRAAQRFLFRLPAEANPAAIRDEMKQVFRHGLIADFRETHPLITRGLDRSATFLSLVSLIALIVGAVGVATAMHSHLQQKMDSIAVMKSLGARSSQIIRIYMIQALMLALAGGVLGVALGMVVELAFPALIARYFTIPAQLHVDWRSVAEGLGVAFLTTLLFVLPPLVRIREIPPSLILRREMAEVPAVRRSRWARLRAPALAAAIILAGIGALASWFVEGSARDAAKVGAWFVGGITVSLAVLSGLAWLLLRGLRLAARRSGQKTPATLRHGIANIYRPGNHAEAVLVALGLGVMFTLTVYLVQHSMLREIVESAPPSMPNVFLINITQNERDKLIEFLKSSPGIEGEPEILISVSAQLVAVDGGRLDARNPDGPARRFRRARSMRWEAAKPKHVDVVAGEWWTTWDPKSPQAAVSEEAAKLLDIGPGSRLEWTVQGRPLAATVAAVFKTDSARLGSNVEFILTPGALDGLPALYFGGIRMRAAQVAALQKRSFELFPAVTVINVAEVIDRVQEVIDQISIVVRFISAFAILAGLIILASSVAGTRFRRVREVAILKTLGAKRRRVAGIFSVEFLILGSVAGIMGSLLASAFSGLVLKNLFDAGYDFQPWPNLVAVAATALVANAAGWLASFRILGQKPLEILRGE